MRFGSKIREFRFRQYLGIVLVQGRTITLPRFFDSAQKQIAKNLPVPILAQNWAKFAILK
jgi:hypothetical protein